MQRHEALSIGEIIDKAIARTGNRDEYERQQACYLWQEVVGPYVNQCTIKRFVDRDVMHVYIASAALKSELTFSSDSIIKHINQLVGKNVISKIVFH